MSRSAKIHVSMVFSAPVEEAWESLTRGELTHVSQRWGPIPGVVAIHDEPPGFFDEPGLSRTLENSDGSTVVETIKALFPLRSIEYAVTELTNSFRHLTSGADASFELVPLNEDSTSVTWRYSWNAHNALVLPLLWLIAHLAFRPYMRHMLERISAAASS